MPESAGVPPFDPLQNGATEEAAEGQGFVDMEIDLEFTDEEWRRIHQTCRALGMSVNEFINYALVEATRDLL